MLLLFQGRSGGRIVNIASMAGILTGLGSLQDSGYTMSKWAVVSLTRGFADMRPNPVKKYGRQLCINLLLRTRTLAVVNLIVLIASVNFAVRP